MKVITGTNEHEFDLEDRKRVFILAQTLGDSKLNAAALTASSMDFQDTRLKIVFSGRELDLVKALCPDNLPGSWIMDAEIELSREIKTNLVTLEPKTAEATLFLMQRLLLICKDLLKWFKQKPGFNLERKREPQTITVRSYEGRVIETFTF
jgi:hypothetical protein